MPAQVVSVHYSASHHFSKQTEGSITLLAGLGVEGDAHCGVTVQHRSRVAKDPFAPNLRQVHLLPCELLEALATQGFAVQPGDLGDNLCTRGIDLLALPQGTELVLGNQARIRIEGLRNPCAQLDRFAPGLMAALLGRDAAGGLVRKGGVMATVVRGGMVRAGHHIRVVLPKGNLFCLKPV